MQYVWVILMLLPSALSQKLKVVGPDAPVFSVSGSDVILPCSVRDLDHPNIMLNAVDMNITWSRSDLKHLLVHFYGNHKDLNTGQIPSYRGRTAVFKEELKNGNTSLKLSNVRVSDEGKYRCKVESRYWEDELSFHLSVEAVGSEPVITVEKYESEKFTLLCESKGWYPEPELQWWNSKGVNLTAETETQAVVDLFNVESRITVEKIDTFYCTVTQRLHVMKGQIDADTLHKFKPNPWKTVGIAIGVLLLVGFLAGVVFYFYNVRSLLNSDRDGRLQHHNLSACQWNYVEVTLLKSEEDLKEFNLRKFDPSDRGVQKLKKVIASSTKALLEDCNLKEESCKVLASVLESENSLTELDLSLNRLEDSGVEKLCDGLKHSNCKLQNLRLKQCSLKEESCKVLASLLSSENSLTELDLSLNDPKDSGVKKLCDGLKSPNCKLQNLSLEDCDLTEKSCADLASVLNSENCKLIELNLSKNRRLKDSGVKKLCEGLKNTNCKLQILRLTDCCITDEGCGDLASALQLNPSLPLNELDLRDNPIAVQMLDKLKETFSDLRVTM